MKNDLLNILGGLLLPFFIPILIILCLLWVTRFFMDISKEAQFIRRFNKNAR